MASATERRYTLTELELRRDATEAHIAQRDLGYADSRGAVNILVNELAGSEGGMRGRYTLKGKLLLLLRGKTAGRLLHCFKETIAEDVKLHEVKWDRAELNYMT